MVIGHASNGGCNMGPFYTKGSGVRGWGSGVRGQERTLHLAVLKGAILSVDQISQGSFYTVFKALRLSHA